MGQPEPQHRFDFIFEKCIISEEGGVFQKFKGCKYLRKGFPFDEASYACDIVKKYTMNFIGTLAEPELILSYLAFLILPWKMKCRIINRALMRYTKFANSILAPIYLKPDYVGHFSRNIFVLCSQFLIGIGISPVKAQRTAKVLATLLENDDAYRYRIEDILSEVTKEELQFSPMRAFKKIAGIIEVRDKQVAHKFLGMLKLMRFFFLSFHVRKAWKKALENTNYSMLQMDDADRYHTLLRGGYDYGGLNEDERKKKWWDIHDGDCPPQVEVTA